MVSGRVAFYAAAYRNGVLIPKSAVAIADPDSVFPMESLHQTFVVHAAMRAIAKSVNKSSDILHTAVGTVSLARKINSISPCTWHIPI